MKNKLFILLVPVIAAGVAVFGYLQPDWLGTGNVGGNAVLPAGSTERSSVTNEASTEASAQKVVEDAGLVPGVSAVTRSAESGVVSVANRMPGTGERARLETSMITGDGIKQVDVERIMGGEEFAMAIARLKNENVADADVVELTEVYSSALRESLTLGKSGLKLDGFACGQSMCMAALEGSSEMSGAFDAWLDGEQLDSAAPMYSLISYPFKRPDGSVSYRLVFSTDPQTPAIAMPFKLVPTVPVAPGRG